MKIKTSFSAFFSSMLMVCLLLSILPQPIQAKNSDDERPIRLRAVAEVAPIGKLFSLGAVSINGITASGEQMLWGGELVQSFSENGAKVSFDSLGLITLKRGAIVRVASSSAVLQDESLRGMLVASLLCGEMNVRLQSGVGAYIQSCGRIFTASNGASFRIVAKTGQAIAEATSGSVQIQNPATQKKYFVRPVGIGSQLSVKARSARQIQVQVTDENDKPVPDLPIIFLLGSAGAGTLRSGAAQGATLTSPTNAQGIATVQYNAGAEGNTTDITATVESTRYSWTGTISVTKAAGFWTPLNTSLVVAGVAAGVATGVVVATQSGSNNPVRPTGGPDVKP